MTREEMQDELPAGWTVLPLRRDGLIEVESDAKNLVVTGRSWEWVRQQVISITLSHREAQG
jgi:hypothetical protein